MKRCAAYSLPIYAALICVWVAVMHHQTPEAIGQDATASPITQVELDMLARARARRADRPDEIDRIIGQELDKQRIQALKDVESLTAHNRTLTELVQKRTDSADLWFSLSLASVVCSAVVCLVIVGNRSIKVHVPPIQLPSRATMSVFLMILGLAAVTYSRSRASFDKRWNNESLSVFFVGSILCATGCALIVPIASSLFRSIKGASRGPVSQQAPASDPQG